MYLGFFVFLVDWVSVKPFGWIGLVWFGLGVRLTWLLCFFGVWFGPWGLKDTQIMMDR